MHPIFKEIQEIAQETWDSEPDTHDHPDAWADCLTFGIECFKYGMDNRSGWTFVQVMTACDAPLPTDVVWTLRGSMGGLPRVTRNVTEYARDEYDGDEIEFLNVSYFKAHASWGFSTELGRMVIEALEQMAPTRCTQKNLGP